MATAAENDMSTANYHGERKGFTMQTYYSIMSKAFQDLKDAGPEHELSEANMITKFCTNVHCKEAIRCSTAASKELKKLPGTEQTFQHWFNIMNGDLQAFL